MSGSVDLSSSSFVDVYLVFVHTLSICLLILAKMPICHFPIVLHIKLSKCDVPSFDSNAFDLLALFARLCMSEMVETRS
jgi:hypothetical protein